jgi:lipopolysaccharide assembly outer membrane protein LptD (OstA)
LIKPRHIFLLIVSLFFAVTVYPQDEQQISDTLSVPVNQQTLKQENDSTKNSKPVFESPITYNSVDSMAVSFEEGDQVVYLYGAANIKYGTIELTADFISVNLRTKEIFATGLKDSTGEYTSKPHFKEGTEEFDCTSLRYNFETSKGFVENVISTQQDGKIHSAKAKMVSKDVFCMVDGKYSTCDADHPHFYLNITKGKIIGKKAIIAGLSYIVVEDFPIYFPFLPYGYIPTFNKTYSSGIILPKYEVIELKGFGLKEGGFYWAASDYFDAKLTGEIYSKGSWGLNIDTRYILKYKFSGNFTFSYRNLITGEKGINLKSAPSFSLRWSHTQDSKSNPSSTFSANVDYLSSGFNTNHEYDNAARYLQNSTSSRVSFRKNFLNSPFSFTADMNITQKTQDSTVALTLPNMTLNMRSIQPLKRKKRVGAKRFYEDFTIAYTANISNSITTKEKELFTTPFSKWKKKVDHNIPITLPSFKLFNFVNFTPGINYRESWYFDYLEKNWVEGYTVRDNETGMEKWVPGQVVEEKKDGFKRNYEYSGSLGTSTTLYGTYQMKNPKSYINAVRHKMDFNLSFSYHPNFKDPKRGFNKWVQIDSLGKMQLYNIFSSSSSEESGSIGFGMNNNLEMKVLNRNDTTSTKKFKKIPIFDNIGFSGNYNLAADSMRLSTINLNLRTKIAGTVLNIGGTLNPYALDSTGRITKEYQWNKVSGLARLGRITSLGTSLGYNFSSDKFGKKAKEKEKGEKGEPEKKTSPASENGIYNQMKIRWGVNLNYSINYTNSNAKPALNQRLGLTFNGNIDFTEKWTSSFTSGFDFETMKITNTQMTITRNLHCWTMSLAFSPFGSRQYYTFTLNANASMLKDLKINKTNTRGF